MLSQDQEPGQEPPPAAIPKIEDRGLAPPETPAWKFKTLGSNPPGVRLGVYPGRLENNLPILTHYVGFVGPHMLALHFQNPAPEQVRQILPDSATSKCNWFKLSKKPNIMTDGVFERAYSRPASYISPQTHIPLPYSITGVERAYRTYVVCMHRMMEADPNRFAVALVDSQPEVGSLQH